MPPRRRDDSRDSYRRRDRRDERNDRNDRSDRSDRRDRNDRNERNDRRDDRRRPREYRDRGDRESRDESRDRRNARDQERNESRDVRRGDSDSLDSDRNVRRNRERDNRERERDSRNRDRERRPRWDVREKSPAKRHKREFSEDEEEEEKRDEPNFESGVLSGAKNSSGGVEVTEVRDITYSEPVDATEPPQSNPFNLFLFEPGQDDPVDKMQLDKRGYYRFGRDSQLNDVALVELSCSKVHAALQFRKIENVNDEGETSYQTNLYVIDLDSTNGTFINDKQIPTSRYVQVLPKDVLSFGDLSTDYVVVREDKKEPSEE